MACSLMRGVVVGMFCLLAGCESRLATETSGGINSKKEPALTREASKPAGKFPESKVVSAPHEATVNSESAIEKCGKELKALKRLDARSYSKRKAQFDRLMSGASVYADVRPDVAGITQDAVDAMYRFRTGKLCNEISHDVLDALARQEGGERIMNRNGN
ncbi:hypothetical protein BSW63_22890 [Salmonella enterica subsp. enterica serovar Enteritidis]|nr:hypothetical protein [Salmonella enterica subsp. enterica serovar Enteritidis]ELC7077845.1 hypothetical protein [Salmonella enterica]